jgi:hypothetical protein
LNKIESLKPIKGVIERNKKIKGLKCTLPKERHFGVDCSSSSLERLLE